MVDCRRHREGFRFLALQPLAQVQFQTPNIFDRLNRPDCGSKGSPLRFSGTKETWPEAPTALVVGETKQPAGDLFILGITLGFIPVTSFADAEDSAHQPDRYPTFGAMATSLFYHRLLEYLGLQRLFSVHFLEPGILQFRHPNHQGRIHATEPSSPLGEDIRSDPQCPAQLWYCQAHFNTLDAPMIWLFANLNFFMQNLHHHEKILLLITLIRWENYQGI